MAAIAIWLCLLVQFALGQDQWRLVYKDGSVAAQWGTPTLSEEDRASLQYAWMWSGTRAPRRLEAAQVGRVRYPDDAARLQVRVAADPRVLALPDLRLIAGPAAMWREIPEDRLPSWTVPASGRLELPLGPAQPWRLRLASRTHGTWWVDLAAARHSVSLSPEGAQGLEVVVTGEDDAPVRGVTGSLLDGSGRPGRAHSWCLLRGEDGRLAVPGLPDREPLLLTAFASGHAPGGVSARPSDFPARLRLRRGATLAGRVTGDRGTPLAGAAVKVTAWVSAGAPHLWSVGHRTDPGGRWKVSGVPAGQAVVSIDAEGYLPLRKPLEVAAEGADLGTLSLQPSAWLLVLARDDLGEPIPGARVEGGAGVAATTDARGLVRLAAVASAPLEVKATARRHQPGRARLDAPLPAEAQVELARAFTVRGRLVNSSGAPVAEGSVRVVRSARQSQEPLDDGGRFEVDLVPGQPVELVVSSPGTRELRIPVGGGQVGESRDLGDLVAPRGFTVIGRLVAARDGAAVGGAHVWLPRPGPQGPAVAWAARDIVETVSGSDGQFRLSGLPAGPAVLRIEAAGFSRAHLELAGFAEGGPAEVDAGVVQLAAGATLRVSVPAATLGAEPAIARLDLRRSWLEADQLSSPVEDGRAVFHHVPAGILTLSVASGRRLLCEKEVSVAAQDEDLDVECRKAAIIVAGQVRVGGAPAGSGMLAWQAPGLDVPSRIDTLVSPEGLRQQQVFGAGRPQVDVEVGSDGSFVSEELAAGRWQVAWLPQLGSMSGSLTVDVPAVDRFDTVLSYPGLALTGVVVDREGEPVDGAHVRELRSAAMVLTRADGSFALVGLQPGRVLVEAQLAERSSAIAEIVLAADRQPDPVRLVLEKRTKPKIEVAVFDAAGAPLPGAFVILEEGGKGQRILTADASGRAIAEIEAPLPERVRVASAGGGWALGDWVSWEEAQAGLSLRLGTGSLVIASRSHQGTPRIASAGGWDLVWLLRLLGGAPILGPAQPLRLDGVPAGQYTVTLSGPAVAVTVEEGKAGKVELE